MSTRLERLRAQFADAQVDVLLVGSADNRRYLSGFSGSAGMLLVSLTGVWLVVDFRYWQQAERQAPDCAIVRLPPMTRFEHTFAQLVTAHGWRRIGVEAESVTLDAYDALADAIRDHPEVSFVKARGLVEQLRAVKDEEEIRRLQAAVDLTDQAMEFAAGLLEPGVTEASVAWQVELFMRTHGAETPAFPTIVAFGPNSALPHYSPGDTALRASDPIVIDMGARVNGYCGDLTRSFCLAPNDGRYAQIYAVVLDALQTAEAEVHAGLTGQEADLVARRVISERGFGEFFGHSLGHSLGLAIHETPTLGRLNEKPLLTGAVVTIEPGIYIPEWGGIRIEDVVWLEEQGTRVLTGSPK